MTPRPFTPRPYQGLIVDHIMHNKRCAVWAGMGMGKTSATLTALDVAALLDDAPTLVLAPMRVAQSTWPDEAGKWQHTQNMHVQYIGGTEKQRLQALAQRDVSVWTTNYEQLPWLVKHWGSRWPYKRVIADESTKLKSFRARQGGKRAGALAKVAFTHVEHFVELTGTPAPNGLLDLWGQIWFLDQGKRLGRTFTSFKERWFRASFDGYGVDPLPHAQAEIQDLLADLCLTVEAKDWFDLRAPIVNTVRVDLPPRARDAYRAMEKEMFAALECGSELEAFNAASRTIKCLQLANGAAYTDDTRSKWAVVHDAKLEALDEIVEEAAGMPVLVAYHFKSDLARLKAAFPRGRELDKNPQTMKDWNAGKIPVLFAHPQSAGHGLSLQDGGNILVYFGHWWNLEERLQILERIGPTRQLQAGHDRPVFVHSIVARDTVDELILERCDTKREVQDILMDAMKRKKAC